MFEDLEVGHLQPLERGDAGETVGLQVVQTTTARHENDRGSSSEFCRDVLEHWEAPRINETKGQRFGQVWNPLMVFHYSGARERHWQVLGS